METRRLTTSTICCDHFDWPGVAQAVRLERTTIRDGKETRTTQYALTSVTRRQANAADLLTWLRGRWGIENKAFWVRDVTFDEDRCRIRSGTAPDTFSRITNAAMNALRAWGEPNMAAALRKHAYRNDHLFARLGIMNL